MRALFVLPAALLAMPLSAPADAGNCHYFSMQQCIEVIDAQQRKIRQWVLIADEIRAIPRPEGTQCSSLVKHRQQQQADYLAAFAQAAASYPACSAAEVSVRSSEQRPQLERQYQRAIRPSEQKTVIPLNNLPQL